MFLTFSRLVPCFEFFQSRFKLFLFGVDNAKGLNPNTNTVESFPFLALCFKSTVNLVRDKIFHVAHIVDFHASYKILNLKQYHKTGIL